MRAALYYANDHPGTTVRFNIPNTDPGYRNGVFTIYPRGNCRPSVADSTVINGSARPGMRTSQASPWTAQVHPGIGLHQCLFVSGLHLYAANCVVRALSVNHFPDRAFTSNAPLP